MFDQKGSLAAFSNFHHILDFKSVLWCYLYWFILSLGGGAFKTCLAILVVKIGGSFEVSSVVLFIAPYSFCHWVVALLAILVVKIGVSSHIRSMVLFLAPVTLC